MNIEFNINEYVKVKLNQSGKDILIKQREELNKTYQSKGLEGFGPYEFKEDENGYVKFQFHELMRTFGHHIPLGFNPPFEPTVLLVVKGEQQWMHS